MRSSPQTLGDEQQRTFVQVCGISCKDSTLHLTASNSRRNCSYKHKSQQLEHQLEQLLLVMKASGFSFEINQSPVMLKYPTSCFSKS